ncbi:phosphatidate phosphatase APP1 [Palleronia aestuarii]|uniref:Phosphatidate phosphatase APP1 n=1 Tax=Palleronia aestuarii TaxID=568105 RepID=A0A2W7MW16_9RHOB|nr:phosphatase domain-containing protein [Palleronia aestuarii]PZX11841.1 phosphatidate phosphatase APP1 [Palleronia aestuarii]
MAGTRGLHKLALLAERIFDRVRPNRVVERPVLDAYRGYATPGGLVLRGRVLASLRRTTPDPGQSRWQNLREMVSLFFTNEVANVLVEAPAHGVSTRSDEEGYVMLDVPGDAAPGWQEIDLQIAGDPESRVSFRAMVPSREARFGVISDIDDTMMHTGAYSLARNLWTTFTGSLNTRKIFPDAVALMDHLSGGGRNPVYYVSSSPWNLHSFLERVFDRAGLVAGPMFLRDYGLSEDKFFTGTHGDHKGDAIDRILAANPDLPFVLVGDTGQHDASVYHAARHRHGSRIAAVILREPRPGPDTESHAKIEAMRKEGVSVFDGPDFAGAAEMLQARGIAP